MKKYLILLFLAPFILNAQSYLKPSIGLNALPANTAPICTIPIYTGSFYTTGLNAGDTAYNFKLYSLTGDSVVLSDLLATGKPVLVVNGNYTCPVFRNKENMINQVAASYSGLIHVIIVNTVEAHPTDISPYFGFINTGNANINAGILFAQPITYLERKNIVGTMINSMNINVPIYIDGPCNEWWSTYGPAPNNAYLIKPNGIIFAKHGWFDKNPTDYIICDIDSLLYNAPCTLGAGAGNFSIQQLDTLVTGVAGTVLYAYTNLINNSNSPITVSAKKIQKNYPSAWQTAFCADVCYSPSEDSIVFIIPANDTMHFSIDFITNSVPDSGAIKIGFRNINNISNQFSIVAKAKTTFPNYVNAIDKNNLFDLYPNPADDVLRIEVNSSNHQMQRIEILDITGKFVLTNELTGHYKKIDITDLKPGMYLVKMGSVVRKLEVR